MKTDIVSLPILYTAKPKLPHGHSGRQGSQRNSCRHTVCNKIIRKHVHYYIKLWNT